MKKWVVRGRNILSGDVWYELKNNRQIDNFEDLTNDALMTEKDARKLVERLREERNHHNMEIIKFWCEEMLNEEIKRIKEKK